MLPNRDGRFLATIAEVGINESGKPPKLCVVLTFNLSQEKTADGWKNIESEGMSIPGYFYLEKNDGSLNDKTIDNFKEVLMWDGKTIEKLTQAKEALVQVTLGWDEYEGKRRIRVQWLNKSDSEPGVKHDPDAVKRAQSRLGAKLRAYSGGSAVPATTPPATPPQVAAPAASSDGFPWEASSADACWSEFTKKFPNLPQAAIGKGWNDLIQRTHPGCADINTLTPEQWGEVWAEMNKPDFKAAV